MAELESKMNDADFWNRPEQANRIVTELKAIRARIAPLDKFDQLMEDARTLLEMAEEADDDQTREEVDQLIDKLEAQAKAIETASLLSGKFDSHNCYLTIYAREGGTEAQDWAEMMMRMYLHYCESMGWDVSEVDKNPGEEAGLKDVTLYIKGPMVFGYLSAERGTHRLARVSPFNAQGKRQTSFAAVEVIPEFEEAGTLEIPEKDLEITPFARSSGPGGQNVNKLATAIRLIHLPTGITVVCSVERKLEQNKQRALAILHGKLELLEEERRQKEIDAAKGGKLDMGWGTQIRSYVFYDNRVKDLRTGYEVGNPQRVLDGDLHGFIEAELRRRAKEAATRPA
ncbi:MAG: peptide chain release factor 2 [Phycisphaeraceae bacterium]|nr:peptide chain release factor 2 [Phycisphaeraceae bacterium]